MTWWGWLRHSYPLHGNTSLQYCLHICSKKFDVQVSLFDDWVHTLSIRSRREVMSRIDVRSRQFVLYLKSSIIYPKVSRSVRKTTVLDVMRRLLQNKNMMVSTRRNEQVYCRKNVKCFLGFWGMTIFLLVSLIYDSGQSKSLLHFYLEHNSRRSGPDTGYYYLNDGFITLIPQNCTAGLRIWSKASIWFLLKHICAWSNGHKPVRVQDGVVFDGSYMNIAYIKFSLRVRQLF